MYLGSLRGVRVQSGTGGVKVTGGSVRVVRELLGCQGSVENVV